MAPIDERTSTLDLTSIHRKLMEGFKAGARMAVFDPAVRENARAASDLKDAFAGVTLHAAMKAALRLTDHLREDTQRWSDELEGIVKGAVDTALVMGAQAIASAPPSEDLAALAEDELWLGSEVERLLLQLVEILVSAGHRIPGAQGFLDRVSPSPDPEILVTPPGPDREVRTSWIRNADTAQVYQWCARVVGPAIVLGRRLRGRRSLETEIEVPFRDVTVLLGVLERLAAGAASS